MFNFREFTYMRRSTQSKTMALEEVPTIKGMYQFSVPEVDQ